MTLLFIYLAIAIGISFICSILEAVLLSITPSFVLNAVKADPQSGKKLQQVKENIDQSISSILILNTFAHTMGAAGVGAQAIKIFGEQKETLIAFLLTLIILYVSEIIPKTLGAKLWRPLAIPSAYAISYLIKLVYPLVWLSSLITRLFGQGRDDIISREEVLAIAALSHKDGAIANLESIIVENILTLRTAKTQQILTPRTVVHALEQAITISEALSKVQTKTFTRMPTFDGSIDKVTGVIIKNELYEQERQGNGDKPLASILSPIYRVSESLPVLNLLDLFIKRQEHLFLVEDGFGQTAGIVTLEDAIETLLGREIVDESDSVEDMQKLAKENYRQRLKDKFTQVSVSAEQNKEMNKEKSNIYNRNNERK
ncbi:MAG: CNNM domain-containing protein [Thalassotalea sp.]